MADPDIDNEDGPAPDFNFLDDLPSRRARSANVQAETLPARRPVIRKPVPVSKSGPLRAPVSEADFVLAPAYKTDGMRVDPASGGGMRELAVHAARELHARESGDDVAAAPLAPTSAPTITDPASNVTPFPDRRSAERDEPSLLMGRREATPEADPSLDNTALGDGFDATIRLEPGQGAARSPRADERRDSTASGGHRRFSEIDDDFDFLADQLTSQPKQGVTGGHHSAGRRLNPQRTERYDAAQRPYLEEEESGRRWRLPVALVACLALVTGLGLFLRNYDGAMPEVLTKVMPWLSESTDTAVADGNRSLEPVDLTGEPTVELNVEPIDVVVPTASSLAERFRSELAQVDELIASGALDDAQTRLETMDRTVFGYGNAEFTEAGERIAQLRKSPASEVPTESDAARLEVERVAAEQVAAEAARVEAARITAERGRTPECRTAGCS